MSNTRTPVVCFIHDLGDQRVWWRLTEALPPGVRTLVVEQTPTGRLTPAALAEQIMTAARAVLPDPGVDLVVASDVAATAGAELVAGDSAAHALLINPDPGALIGHPDYQVPEPGAETRELLQAMAPYQEQLLTHGTLPTEGISAMVNHSLGRLDALDEQDRSLLSDIATARLTQSMPWDLSAAFGAAPQREEDWFAHLSASPERFTVYSGKNAGLGTAIRTVLSRNVPQTHVMRGSTHTAFPWLETPTTLAALITELVGPESQNFRQDL